MANAQQYNVSPKADKRNNLKAAYSILANIYKQLNESVELNKPLNTDLISQEMEKDICIALQ
jgi:hypothetical protein